jgi:hypothetical protein
MSHTEDMQYGARIERQKAEIERLRVALKPFADYVGQLEGKPASGSGPTRADWLAARDAYEQ